MSNKKIQEERIRNYFLDSAKNLLRAEGLGSISVRNVAYHAGYSYATLYNYFQDINALLFSCVEDFCREVEGFAAQRSAGCTDPKERLRVQAKAYAEYFVEYPGVFELFFLEKMGDFGGRSETAELITGLLDRICRQAVEECVRCGAYSAGEAGAIMDRLRYVLPGLLLLYENRLYPDNYATFMEKLDSALVAVIY